MKNRPFLTRIKFAATGVRSAWNSEASFRTQIVLGGLSFVLLGALRPKPVWWAIVILTSGFVLSFELINTALEYFVDRMHPEVHPSIAQAKDCAAAAVLVSSIASLGILIALLIDHFY